MLLENVLVNDKKGLGIKSNLLKQIFVNIFIFIYLTLINIIMDIKIYKYLNKKCVNFSLFRRIILILIKY